MSPESGNREFDSPERYEREKATRVMPSDLKELELYTWRMKTPPSANGKPYAIEYVTCVTGVERQDNGEFAVGFVFFPKQFSNETAHTWTSFSAEGFTIIETEDGEVIEMGYFVGSTDPYDVELAELVAKANELVNV